MDSINIKNVKQYQLKIEFPHNLGEADTEVWSSTLLTTVNLNLTI